MCEDLTIQQSLISVCPYSSSVPAAVGEVRVSNNGRMDFLSVSWRPAPGEVDNYLVILRDRREMVHSLAVSRSSPECVFNSLVSGRLYNISIASRSGSYQNHTFVQERTRKSISDWFQFVVKKIIFKFSRQESHKGSVCVFLLNPYEINITSAVMISAAVVVSGFTNFTLTNMGLCCCCPERTTHQVRTN